VHGLVGPSVPPQAPMDQVRETLDRMRARRIWPESPTALGREVLPGPPVAARVTAGRPGAGPRPGGQTHVTQLVLILVLLLMATISSILLGLTKKQGWW